MHIPILIKNEIDWLIYNFIWNGNTDKVCRNIFMQKICNGGYNMHDFNTVDKSLKIMWMKYLLDENNNIWKGYILEVLGKENINILFRSKYTEYMVPSFSKLPLFYKEVFTHWKFVKYKNNDNAQEIKSQFVWYNSDVFRKDDGPFYNKSLFQAGLWYIKDIFDKEGKIVSFEIWLKRGVTYKHYLAWRKVISLVEMTVKKKIQELNNISDINIFTGIELSGKRINLSKIKIKTLKEYYAANSLHLKKSTFTYKNIEHYNSIFGQITEKDWQNIFLLSHTLPVENKIRDIQYKILFRFLTTSKLLYKIKKINNPNCRWCLFQVQTIEHLILECPYIKNFWIKLLEFWNVCNNKYNIQYSMKDILFGYNTDDITMHKPLNTLILQAKAYIYNCHLKEKSVNLPEFFVHLKYYVSIYILATKNTSEYKIVQEIKKFVSKV